MKTTTGIFSKQIALETQLKLLRNNNKTFIAIIAINIIASTFVIFVPYTGRLIADVVDAPN